MIPYLGGYSGSGLLAARKRIGGARWLGIYLALRRSRRVTLMKATARNDWVDGLNKFSRRATNPCEFMCFVYDYSRKVYARRRSDNFT